MRLSTARDGNVLVARPTGDIDFGAATELGRDLLRAIPDDCIGLVLDLAEVRYVDSGGVRMLFDVAAQLRLSDRALAIAAPEMSPLRRLLKITRVEEVALLCTSSDECAEMIRAG